MQATIHGVAKSRARLSDFTSFQDLNVDQWLATHHYSLSGSVNLVFSPRSFVLGQHSVEW